MQKFKALIKRVWANDNVRRVAHTFWQSFAAVFLVGITGIVSGMLSTHNISDGSTALLALVTSAVAAGLAALKGLYVTKKSA